MSKPKQPRRQQYGGTVKIAVPSNTDSASAVRFNAPTQVRSGRYQGTTSRTQILDIQSEDWKNAVSWAPADSYDFALDQSSDSYDHALYAPVMEDKPPTPPPQKKARSCLSQRPNAVWAEKFRQQYLDELMRLDGRGDYIKSTQCPDCVARKSPAPKAATIRCISGCFVPDLVCADCCVRRHRNLPFHKVEKWDGVQFQPVTLKALGLRIQLNHSTSSSSCPIPVPCHSNLVVMHTNGIHEVAFNFCGCSRAVPLYLQLLRRRIFPATQQKIQTCATFDLLDLLHKLALTSKGSMLDLYVAIEKLTDSTGLCTPKNKYRTLMRMMLQYRHLKMGKWGGRGLEPSGIEGTPPGGMAMICLSCPYPDINLPEDWMSAPEEDQFLYRAYTAMDANFRLKNQLVSSYSQSPDLDDGLAFMVPRKPYEAYQLQQKKDDDISTCVGFQAMLQANTRFSRGLRYTGVAGVFCARSETVLPLGLGNLQKGERFSVMDYVFACAIKNSFPKLKNVLISYDIACQWFVNLANRMKESVWPTDLKLPDDLKLVPAIPKLHEPMHAQVNNHQQYSLNYMLGVGHTDAECPERCWGCHNALGTSTRNNAPGTRHTIMNDNFNWWNWLKAITLGSTLARRFRVAVADRNQQEEAHRSLTSRLSSDLVAKWESRCIAWDKDPYPKTVENPYEYKVDEAMTEAAVRRDFAKAEEARLVKGGAVQRPPADFISLAIDIEDTQRRLKRVAKDTPETAARREGGLAEQRNQLRNQIRSWEELLPSFMPGLSLYLKECNKSATTSGVKDKLDDDDDDDDDKVKESDMYPENITIWVPSLIPANKRAEVCHPEVADIEEKYRSSQCTDALAMLRHILKVKSRLIHFKNKNIRGQKAGTRSRAIIDRVHLRARMAVDKYRHARQAKFMLSGSGDWEKTLRVLADSDIRLFSEGAPKPTKGRPGTLEDGQSDAPRSNEPAQTDDYDLDPKERGPRDGTGETRKEISWIWLTPSATAQSVDGEPDSDDSILSVEWAKSRARCKRADEEVRLLREEMRRTLATLEWRASNWRNLAGKRTENVDAPLKEGLQAYAIRQSNLQIALRDAFKEKWKAPLDGKDDLDEDEDSEGDSDCDERANEDINSDDDNDIDMG
ncbi:hypothetical protein CVT24_012717 [Panaeolus cyanescens]|uniref:CxC2-like cysteine cluster KDZ transposase-associated domain-containing protein n=1 Tax=Panaeolus cyanescens TaxID=181874 RepID=A0A409W6S6_9AGAR|nr:hypothetical protein CVT24_012717 [Panaeolus cyanescens]